MNESRETQEIVVFNEQFTPPEAAMFKAALEAEGIRCQIAAESGPKADPNHVQIWLRGNDVPRAMAVMNACRAAATRKLKAQP
jgi:hypothetical protein